ncbi:MAG TPA: NAD(P)H-dependent oxidoreductase, partial [Gaiellaceae bacterium]|nr:NAD(P)H-dependent oxidoreductase [Gaiellaceae bacterium]
MKILAVSGSLREGSYNTALLREAARVAPEGVEVELWEGIGDLPVYDQDLDGDDVPVSARRLRDAWGSAD